MTDDVCQLYGTCRTPKTAACTQDGGGLDVRQAITSLDAPACYSLGEFVSEMPRSWHESTSPSEGPCRLGEHCGKRSSCEQTDFSAINEAIALEERPPCFELPPFRTEKGLGGGRSKSVYVKAHWRSR